MARTSRQIWGTRCAPLPVSYIAMLLVTMQ
jgi:hypothetical protein